MLLACDADVRDHFEASTCGRFFVAFFMTTYGMQNSIMYSMFSSLNTSLSGASEPLPRFSTGDAFHSLGLTSCLSSWLLL